MLEVALPAGIIVVLAVAGALWVRAAANARLAGAVHDLRAAGGFEGELAATLDAAEVIRRVLAAAAALPGADAALLVADGRAEALGLSAEEAERLAPETPAAGPGAVEVVYVAAAGTGLVAPLRADARALGALAAVRRGPGRFPETAAPALESLARRAGPALANAWRFAEAARLAELDPLTGLANHRVFHQLLAREVARSQRYDRRLGLILLDLDDFKRINDRIGHLAGDAALAEVASRLRGVVRSSDIACRVGGDEFGVILPESTQGDAERLAERVEQAVAAAPVAAAGPLRVSAGAAELVPGETASALFERADAELYRAKSRSGA